MIEERPVAAQTAGEAEYQPKTTPPGRVRWGGFRRNLPYAETHRTCAGPDNGGYRRYILGART